MRPCSICVCLPRDDCRTLLEVPEDALDLLQCAAEVFRDLSRQLAPRSRSGISVPSRPAMPTTYMPRSSCSATLTRALRRYTGANGLANARGPS